MSDNTNAVLSRIRPLLRHIAPMAFWFSAGFGVFNILIGLGLYNAKILITLQIAGVVPFRVWGILFLVLGVLMIYSLLSNNWKLTKNLNLVGIGIKLTWWLELLSELLTGTSKTPFLIIIWSLLLFFQFIVFIYFTPRVEYGRK